MIGYSVKTEFVWGFQARVAGLSKTSPSFYYPPPTTILGALAAPIAKHYGFGERLGLEVVEGLSRNLLAIGIRPINFVSIRYEDINRIIATKITSGKLYPNPQKLSGSFDSPARGKTITISFDENPPTLEIIFVFSNEELKVREQTINLQEEFFWKITRLGSKESIVSVTDVNKFGSISKARGIVETKYSFPADWATLREAIDGEWKIEDYVNPYQFRAYNRKINPLTNYLAGKNILKYYVPINIGLGQPQAKVETKSAVAYRVGSEIVIGRGA